MGAPGAFGWDAPDLPPELAQFQPDKTTMNTGVAGGFPAPPTDWSLSGGPLPTGPDLGQRVPGGDMSPYVDPRIDHPEVGGTNYYPPGTGVSFGLDAPPPQGPAPATPPPGSVSADPSSPYYIPGYNPNTGVVTPVSQGGGRPAPAASQPFNYEGARDAWMSGRYGTDEAGAARWAAEFGVPYSGGDTITLPNGGGNIDIIGNFRGGGRRAANWTPAGGNGPNPGGQGVPGIGTNVPRMGAGAPGGPGAGFGPGGGPGGNLGFGNELLDTSYAKLINSMSEPKGLDAGTFESIRQPIDAARRAALNQSTAELASRGLLSEPGHESGALGTAGTEIEKVLGPAFATETQRAATANEFNRRNTLLQGLQGGTQRQHMLATVALQNLSENRLWNEFIANFGLNQQQVQAQIQQGNIQSLVPLLQLYLQNAPPTQTQTGTTQGGRSLGGS